MSTFGVMDDSDRRRKDFVQAVGDPYVGGHNIRLGTARDVNVSIGSNQPPDISVSTSVDPPLGRRDPAFPLRGRDDLIADLRRPPDRRDSVAGVRVLHGLGGCGKTSIALELAHLAVSAELDVWWVTADRINLTADMRAIARRLGVDDTELRSPNLPDVLWRRLHQHHRRWLLVFDNADDPTLLAAGAGTVADGRGWIRPHNAFLGLVVVTSRYGDRATWGSWSLMHAVDSLAVESAADVLLDYVDEGAGERGGARALAASLGGLPLALRLAGLYLRAARQTPPSWAGPELARTFADYATAINRGGLEVLNDPAASNDQERSAITRPWEISLDFLDSQGKHQARDLLRLLSNMADAPIPHEILLNPKIMSAMPISIFPTTGRLAWLRRRMFQLGRRLLAYIFPPVFPGLDSAQLVQLIEALDDLGLLDRTISHADDEAKTMPVLRIHPLVRHISRRQLDDSCRSLAAGLLVAAAQDPQTGAPTEPASWPTWRLIAPHVSAIFDAIADANDMPKPLKKRLISEISIAADLVAHCMRNSGDYAESRHIYERILDASVRLTRSEDPSILTIRHRVAAVTGQAGDAASARDQFAALLTDRERLLGVHHPDTLMTRHSLAVWTGNAGDPVAGRDQLADLLPISERVLGPNDLAIRHCLALATAAAGDPTAGCDQLAELVSTAEQLFGADDSYTLRARRDHAFLVTKAGDVAWGQAVLTTLLPRYESVFGVEHPETLEIRRGLAVAAGKSGELFASLDDVTELLRLYERVLGAEHPQTLHTRHILAHLADDAEKHVREVDE